ncbi:unnamed protein product, partial [Musa acuminata subsp. malaccensis]
NLALNFYCFDGLETGNEPFPVWSCTRLDPSRLYMRPWTGTGRFSCRLSHYWSCNHDMFYKEGVSMLRSVTRVFTRLLNTLPLPSSNPSMRSISSSSFSIATISASSKPFFDGLFIAQTIQEPQPDTDRKTSVDVAAVAATASAMIPAISESGPIPGAKVGDLARSLMDEASPAISFSTRRWDRAADASRTGSPRRMAVRPSERCCLRAMASERKEPWASARRRKSSKRRSAQAGRRRRVSRVRGRWRRSSRAARRRLIRANPSRRGEERRERISSRRGERTGQGKLVERIWWGASRRRQGLAPGLRLDREKEKRNPKT